MAYSKTWVEGDPDGSQIFVSQLDNAIRDTKVAVRERLERDPAVPLSGIFETNTFDDAPMVVAGSGRFYFGTEATLGTAALQSGRGYFTTDAGTGHPKIYSMEGGGSRQVGYLNRDGSRTMEGTLSVFIAGIQMLLADADGVLVGSDNTNANRAGGYPYIPFVVAAPSVNPPDKAGRVAIAFNTGNNKLYIKLNGGAWLSSAAFT